MERRRILCVIADGMGDRPIPTLAGRTPLEAAKKPNLDRLAERGITGLVHLFRPGVPVGTDVGHLCLFGYDPLQVYSGRGPIEAYGAGLTLVPGDVAWRGNFATVDGEGHIVDRRAGRIREGTAELARALDGIELGDGVSALVRAGTEHRAAVVFRGAGLEAAVSDSDPGAAHPRDPVKEVQPRSSSEGAQRTAAAANRFFVVAQEVLSAHPVNQQRVAAGLMPANAVLLRSAGVMPAIPPLTEMYGLRAGLVSGEDTVLALGTMAGMTVVTRPGMTGSYDTDLGLKARCAVELLADHDLVYLHVKASDLAGHDNKPEEKARVIEAIDGMVGQVLASYSEPLLVAMAADHSTPCEYGEHTGEPVPVFISGPGVRTDDVRTYGERTCARGGLGHLSGQGFFMTLLNLIGKAPKMGS